jgi:preprotein translocase subunit SecA
MEGRRFSEGLHQALEAKEHVKVRAETQTLATITLQNYFRLYEKLAGMTGTALTEDSEFRQIYKMPVVPIPTNKPVVRRDEDDYIFRTIDAKYKAVADEVQRRHEIGQPVLVGTSSIEGSERIGRLLEKRGVPHHVLNAKNHEAEAKIIAQAGRVGAVTIATNMAGRGTDILLGGNKEQLVAEQLATHYKTTPAEAPDWMLDWAEKGAQNIIDSEGYAVRLFGGLCVIGTDRHEARRIDNQLRGRSGRQGDVGESRFCLSLEDNLLRRFGKDRLDSVSALMVKQGLDDSTPLQDPLVTKVINLAQHQVESMHFAARKNVLEYDDVMNLQRKAIYAERNSILDGKNVSEHLPEIVEDVVWAAVNLYCPINMPSDDWDFKNLQAWFTEISGLDAGFLPEIDHDDEPMAVADAIIEKFTQIISEKTEALGAEAMNQVQTQMILRLIDNRWIDHLSDMEHLKSGIGLRAIGHRDPLVEYKEEAYDAFDVLVSSIYEGFVNAILRMPIESEQDTPAIVLEDNPFDPSNMVYSNTEEDYGSDDILEPQDPLMGSGK